MSKYLFIISHPAHFHMFKQTIKQLNQGSNQIKILIRPKDVLLDLCKDWDIDYSILGSRPEKGGVIGLAFSMIRKDLEVLRIVKSFKPDLMIGSDGSIARAGFITGVPSIEFSEDDAKAIKLYAFISYTFFSQIVSPLVTDAWLWKGKKVGYNGYQKLAYLHPENFQADINIKETYVKEKTFFLLRFSALNAYHDLGMKGFDINMVQRIIKILEPHGKVYISSEKALDEQLKEYELKINPSDLHHVLACASLLIGDSQSMTVEAALLGIPSIRYSSFVGKLTVLEELEHKYGLTYGFKPDDGKKMIDKIEDLVKTTDLTELFQLKRSKLLLDKINVTDFYVWFIENYPKSVEVMRENPDYQLRFK